MVWAKQRRRWALRSKSERALFLKHGDNAGWRNSPRSHFLATFSCLTNCALDCVSSTKEASGERRTQEARRDARSTSNRAAVAEFFNIHHAIVCSSVAGKLTKKCKLFYLLCAVLFRANSSGGLLPSLLFRAFSRDPPLLCFC